MNRLKELRENKNLSQEEAAKILNVSQQQYSRYESELSHMTYNQLINLAIYYDTSIDYILYRTDKREPYPKSMINKK